MCTLDWSLESVVEYNQIFLTARRQDVYVVVGEYMKQHIAGNVFSLKEHHVSPLPVASGAAS